MTHSMRPANNLSRLSQGFQQEPRLTLTCSVLTSPTSNTRWHRLNGRSNWGNYSTFTSSGSGQLGCWCHFLQFWFSPVLFLTWEEVCTSHEYLPVDKAQCIHIYLFQSRFTVPQVHCSFQHFWGHIADRTDLGKYQIKASHQEVISKFN